MSKTAGPPPRSPVARPCRNGRVRRGVRNPEIPAGLTTRTTNRDHPARSPATTSRSHVPKLNSRVPPVYPRIEVQRLAVHRLQRAGRGQTNPPAAGGAFATRSTVGPDLGPTPCPDNHDDGRRSVPGDRPHAQDAPNWIGPPIWGSRDRRFGLRRGSGGAEGHQRRHRAGWS